MKSIIVPALLAITALAAREDEIKRLDGEVQYATQVSAGLVELSDKLNLACNALNDNMTQLEKLCAKAKANGHLDHETIKIYNEILPVMSVCANTRKEYDELNEVATKTAAEHKRCIDFLARANEQEAKVECERAREHFLELERLVGPSSYVFPNSANVIPKIDAAIAKSYEIIRKYRNYVQEGKCDAEGYRGTGLHAPLGQNDTFGPVGPHVVVRPPVITVENKKDDESESPADPQVDVKSKTVEHTKDESTVNGATQTSNTVITPPLPLYIRQTPIAVLPQGPKVDTGVGKKEQVPEPRAPEQPTGFDSPQSRESEASTGQESVPTQGEQTPTVLKKQRASVQGVENIKVWKMELLKWNKVAIEVHREAFNMINTLDEARKIVHELIEESRQFVANATGNKPLENLLNDAVNLHTEFEQEFENKCKHLEEIMERSDDLNKRIVTALSSGPMHGYLDLLKHEVGTATRVIGELQGLYGNLGDVREYARTTLSHIKAIASDIEKIFTALDSESSDTDESDDQASTTEETSPEEQLVRFQDILRGDALEAKKITERMDVVVEKIKLIIEEIRRFALESGNSLDNEIAELLAFERDVFEHKRAVDIQLNQMYVKSNLSLHGINELLVGRDEDVLSEKVPEVEKLLQDNRNLLKTTRNLSDEVEKTFQELDDKMSRIIRDLNIKSNVQVDSIGSLRGHVQDSESELDSSDDEPSATEDGTLDSLDDLPQSDNVPTVSRVDLVNTAITLDGRLREKLEVISTAKTNAVGRYEKAEELYNEFMAIFSNVSDSRAVTLATTHASVVHHKSEAEKFYHAIVAKTGALKASVDELLGRVGECLTELAKDDNSSFTHDEVFDTCTVVLDHALQATSQNFDQSIEEYLGKLNKEVAIIRSLVDITTSSGKFPVNGNVEPKNHVNLEKPVGSNERLFMLVDLSALDTARNFAESIILPTKQTGGEDHANIQGESVPTKKLSSEHSKEDDQNSFSDTSPEQNEKEDNEPSGGMGHVHVQEESTKVEVGEASGTAHSEDKNPEQSEPTEKEENAPTEHKFTEDSNGETPIETNDEQGKDQDQKEQPNQNVTGKEPGKKLEDDDDLESSGFKTLSCVVITFFAILMQF
ncbi:conserved hypothetical protein [Theileria equi strain WA]|uniref:Uncharacterized protein n=1 Tax=Theileria equi strain WA TaxID=1537102 RepID=L1L9Y7_THEEQ|nr:conserved hypothetical protein [Theileria equi strain WA]EKX72005.1 conserved hypothetical protein [Theileria equi strain WA]|eukprot:XP_004831457.1 conserved hypothetical protein [Theileria equi strain WA]